MKITFKNFIFFSAILGGAFSVHAQTEEQRQKIVQGYDIEKLTQLQEKFKEKAIRDKEEVLRFAKANNLKLSFTEEDGSYSELVRIDPDGTPIYYTTRNSGSALTSRVNQINSNGSMGLNLNGQNMIVGEWDAGPVRATHQDLAGRVVLKDGVPFEGPSGGSDHATHVAGTMIGSGAGNGNARGMAYQATLWANTWDGDLIEMSTQAGQGLLISNHSYGMNLNFAQLYHFGAYTSESSYFDEIIHAAPGYLAIVAAGNERQNFQTYNPTKAGRDMLTGKATSKNVMVVAAVNQVNNYANGLSVNVADFSNWGPTDDGRVKPDISTKGLGVFSTLNTEDNAYGVKQGTSMAAPGIAGALILLQQHYNNLNNSFMKAATVKAVAIHTADEAGTGQNFPGPDHKYGWGLMNAAKAAQTITDNGQLSIVEEHVLNQGQTYTRTVYGTGAEVLKATVAWTDVPGAINSGTVDSSTRALINDLDVRVTKGTTVYYPWKLNMSFIQGGAKRDNDNNVDNVEKIEVLTAESGLYTITVTHKDGLVGGSQAFSLIVTGIDQNLSNSDFSSAGFQLYPNPANDSFKISLGDNISDVSTVELYDVLGKNIMSKELKSSQLADYNFDISGLESGMYVVKVKQGSQIAVKKLIKK